MTLASIHAGEEIVISGIRDKTVEAKAVRFGIHPGARVRCIRNIRKGPVILGKNSQEIAFGRRLAEQISVTKDTGQE